MKYPKFTNYELKYPWTFEDKLRSRNLDVHGRHTYYAMTHMLYVEWIQSSVIVSRHATLMLVGVWVIFSTFFALVQSKLQIQLDFNAHICSKPSPNPMTTRAKYVPWNQGKKQGPSSKWPKNPDMGLIEDNANRIRVRDLMLPKETRQAASTGYISWSVKIEINWMSEVDHFLILTYLSWY